MKKKQLQSLVREELNNLLQEIDPSSWRTGDWGGAGPSTALAIAGRGKEAAKVSRGMQKATMKLIDTYVMDITYAKAVIVALSDVAQAIAFLMMGPVYGIRYKKDKFSDDYRDVSLAEPSRVGKKAYRGIAQFSQEFIDGACKNPDYPMDPDAREACLNAEKQNTMVHQNEGEMEFYYIWDVIEENYALFKECIKESEYGYAALIGVFLVLDCLAVVLWFLKITKAANKAASKLARKAIAAKRRLDKSSKQLKAAFNNSGNKKLQGYAKQIEARQASF